MKRRIIVFFLFFIFVFGGISLASCDLRDIADAQEENYNLNDIKFEDKTYSYDFESHSLEIEGDLPEGIEVEYENNGHENVGKYRVKAIFTKNGTTISTKTAYLTIVGSFYTSEDISFPDRTYEYDGTIPEPKVEGKYKDSAYVTYEYNIEAEPGTYTAKATVIDPKGNFIKTELTATITITTPSFKASDIVFNNKEVVYDGSSQSILIENNLPKYISVSYEGNEKTEIGSYEITAKFSVADEFKKYVDDIPDKKAVLSIVENEEAMTGIIFSDKSFKYDGSSKSLEATNIPHGITVSYDNNGKIDAGSYIVTAHFKSSTKTYPDMMATLTIEKGDFDMSNVKFEDQTIFYDAQNHFITIPKLPTDLYVNYVNNGKKDVGSYEVIAKFFTTNKNYEAPADMQATLTIKMPSFDSKTVEFNNKEVVYDGYAHSIVIKNELPTFITVEYSGNNQVDIGDYEITATFKVLDIYKDFINDIEPVKAILSIVASAEDITGIVFESNSFTYTGEPKSIKATNVPNGVNVTYEGNDQINVGTYTVTAHFASANRTYPDKVATLTIEKGVLDMSNVKFNDASVAYDGNSHSIYVENLPLNISVEYEANNQTNIGEYIVKAIFTSNDNNYRSPSSMTAKLNIIASKVKIKFIADSCTYDGEEHGVSYEGTLPNGVTISGIEKKYVNAGTYDYLISINSTNLDDLINYNFDIDADSVQAGTNLFSNIYKMQLVIDKATYDYSKIKLDEGSFKYANGKYSVGLSAVLDNGILVRYDFNDENIVTNADGTLSGVITIKLSFGVSDPNYNNIPDMFVDLDLSKINTNLTFDVNGGKALDKNVWTLADLISNGGAPKTTKEGYSFKGWVYDDNGEEVTIDYEAMKSLAGNITLKAKWGEKIESLTYKLSTDETYYIVNKYTPTDETEIVIPATYNGLRVKEIASYVFNNKDTIQGVTLGENIEKISNGNFYNCKNLEYLVLSKNLKELGPYCINNLPLLKTLEFKGKVLTSIEYASFSNLPLIEEIDLSNQSLKHITNPTSNNHQAFTGNEKLNLVKLPACLEYFTGLSFRNNSPSFNIVIPANSSNYVQEDGFVYSKDYSTFVYMYESFDDDYTIKNTVSIIGEGACYNCSEMFAFRGNNTLTKIESFAFSGCINLIKFVFTKCEIVEDNAFYNCGSIVFLDGFIESLKEIGNNAFYKSRLYGTIKLSGSLRSTGDSAFAETNISVLDISNLSSPTFKCNNVDTLTKVLFTPNLTEMPKEAFANCTSLTTLDSLQALRYGEKSFENTAVDISTFDFSYVTYVGVLAFAKLNLNEAEKTLNAPNLKEAEAYSFYNQNITAANLGKIEYIGFDAFGSSYYYENKPIVIDAAGTQNVTIQLCGQEFVNFYEPQSGGTVTNYDTYIEQRTMEIKINSTQKVYRDFVQMDLIATQVEDFYNYRYPTDYYAISYGAIYYDLETNRFSGIDVIVWMSLHIWSYGYKTEITTFNKYLYIASLEEYTSSQLYSNAIKITIL